MEGWTCLDLFVQCRHRNCKEWPFATSVTSALERSFASNLMVY